MKTKYTEYLRCQLTDTEIADAARELARANARRASIEQQKKEVDSQLKGEIEAQNTIIVRLATLINNGAEFRNIDCEIRLDTPDVGRKTIYRTDTGEEVAVKPMTDADRQMVLDLEQKADAEEAAKNPPPEPIVTPPPYVLRIAKGERITLPDGTEAEVLAVDCPTPFDGDAEPKVEAALAQAAVMGGTHQRKQRKARDAKQEAAAAGSEDE